MCDQQPQSAYALISAQNHGTLLVMVAWLLACLLALYIVARIFVLYRSQHFRYSTISDEFLFFAAALCALGSTVVIFTAVDSGLGKRRCLLTAADIRQIQVKVFVSTILFILAVSISTCSALLFLHRLTRNLWQRVEVVALGVLLLLWTIVILAGMIFQCEMPKPWSVWTGKCIPLVPFWVTGTVVEIVIDTAMILVSAQLLWSLLIPHRHKTLVILLCLLRLVLVAASIVRIFYLQPAFSRGANLSFDYIPYAITTQCHSTLAVLFTIIFITEPFTSLRQVAQSQEPNSKSRRHTKQWSGSTTIGGTPYSSYSPKTSQHQIIKEPLPSIQASMSTPTSPASSLRSLSQHNGDIILPEIPMPLRYKKAPPRPPPPTDEERPDLSMFHNKMIVQQPSVTHLGNGKEGDRNQKRSNTDNVRAREWP